MAEFEKLLKTVFYYADAHRIAMATEGKERLRLWCQWPVPFWHQRQTGQGNRENHR